ncbi:hypothetical protein BK809_0001955 [Diplodia seriata]|uniref:Integral membrane protein n=1 Tax=Diplodia seriata TaxID=420778 RepID=A0A1S8BC16_9PEZI|nr:hypothetical protein BK809_0001955 [Diplodia seriata]
MPLSTPPLLLRLTATILGTIPLLFGINALLRPAHALSFFTPLYPSYPPDVSSPERRLIDALLVVYGARDVFMGLAVLVPLWAGSRKVAGVMMVAGAGVAGVDGGVCRAAGGGEWDHWGYAPVLAGVGVALMV